MKMKSIWQMQDRELVQIVDNAFADAARRSGQHLLCRPGCTQCCHGTFAISPLDALRLRTAMVAMQQASPARFSEISTRAHQFLEEFSTDFPGNPETGILGTGDEDQQAFENFANEAPCPALNPETGECDLYDARPMTCRTFGPPVPMSPASEDAEASALAVCELCFTSATPAEIAAAEMHPPFAQEAELLDQILAQSPDIAGDTIIAFCLAPPQDSPTAQQPLS